MKEEESDLGLSGAELTAAARFGSWFRRTILRRPDPAAVLRRRAEVREEIRQTLQWPDKDYVPEVLIVKHNKYDKYGNLDRRLIGRGASDWFKAEVKGLHDRGLEVYSAIEEVVIRRGKARRVREETPNSRKVWVVGRIPYERIAYMDWEPDPYYSSPRFYVAYRWRRNPFREVVLYEGSPRDYLYEMPGLKYIGEGGGPIKRLRNLVWRIRFAIDDRRMQRRARREQYGG